MAMGQQRVGLRLRRNRHRRSPHPTARWRMEYSGYRDGSSSTGQVGEAVQCARYGAPRVRPPLAVHVREEAGRQDEKAGEAGRPERERRWTPPPRWAAARCRHCRASRGRRGKAHSPHGGPGRHPTDGNRGPRHGGRCWRRCQPARAARARATKREPATRAPASTSSCDGRLANRLQINTTSRVAQGGVSSNW